MKLLKISAIVIVGALCIFAAVYLTKAHVAEEAAREKSLAEAILQNQIKQELQQAEEQAKEELGDSLVTTVVTTRPPQPTEAPTEERLPTQEAPSTEEVLPTETPPETAEPEKEEIVTEFTRGMLPTDRSGLPTRSMITLTDTERERVINFLIDHYFLDGAVYVGAETRPQLKDKKQLAHDMEQGAIRAVNLLYSSINMNDLTSVMRVDYDGIRREIMILRNNFRQEYRDCRVYGKQFGALYDGCLAYFERLITAMGRLDTVAREYNSSTNPVLAAALMMSKLEEVVIPEAMAVIEGSFGLIEASQEIFLEGTQGAELLTREEVTDIIINPALVLDTGLA